MSAAGVPCALSDLASPGDPCGIGSTVLDVPTLEMKEKKKI